MLDPLISSKCRASVSALLGAVSYSPSTIAVFGSVAKGTDTDFSDLDLLVVRESDEPRLFRTQMILAGRRVQAVIGSETVFSRRMSRARRERDNFISHAFASSVMLYGDPQAYRRLLDHAVTVEQTGPPLPTDREIAGYGMRIHDALLKLNIMHDNDALSAVLHLTRLIHFFIFRRQGLWITPGLYGRTLLRAAEPEFYPQYCELVRDSLVSGSTDSLVAHVRAFLANCGFPSWESDVEAPL